MSSSRQLAAIMFTDIVGYTALMGRDEQKAFELLNRNRQIQKPVIEQYHGRWIKELGDGVMASFKTVSDAVTAAIKIQQAANTTGDFQLRIGIHLGEVVFENNDVFGDGVNIASRIQALAIPGAVWVSEAVHNNVVNKNDIDTEYVKTAPLKNVKEPARIYQVIAEGLAREKTEPLKRDGNRKKQTAFIVLGAAALLVAGYFILYRSGTAEKTGSLPAEEEMEKSIAVLPFVDESPAKDQAYLGDGLAEEIINSITAIKDVKVIGRTSSFQFKGKEMDAQTIGEKLNVGTVLEGTIQKSGNLLRITASLVRVKDKFMIWSQRFDRELKDIFAIQDSIAFKIVEKLKLTLSASERPRLIKKETSQEVYSDYLKALYTYKNQSYEESIDYNLRAIRIDSAYAPSYAYIALAKTWIIARNNSFSDFNAIREAKEFARKAIRLDPTLAEGYSALALMAWRIELDFAEARLNFEKSIQLNPSASLIKNRYGYFLIWMGDFDKALSMAFDAMQSDPADYNSYIIVSTTYMYKKQYRDAKKYITEGQRLFPDIDGLKDIPVANSFYAGDYDEVIRYVKSTGVNDTVPPSESLGNRLRFLYLAYLKQGRPAESRAILALLKRMTPGKQTSFNYFLASIHAQSGETDSCFIYLEKAFENHETYAIQLLKIDPLLDPIRNDPRYRQLYRRYGYDRYK